MVLVEVLKFNLLIENQREVLCFGAICRAKQGVLTFVSVAESMFMPLKATEQ